MDVAAAGFAAAQIASNQRSQQAALSGIRAEQQQQKSVANLLKQAVGAPGRTTGSEPTTQQSEQSAPSAGGTPGNATPGAPASSGSGRGSLVNILA